MSLRVYLDYNASAPLRPAARDAMLIAMDLPGNASSVHGEGRAVRALIETARRQVAALVGANPRGVVFTSSATEAAALVLTPSLVVGGKAQRTGLLLGATEHACVLAGHRFGEAQTVPVHRTGLINLEALAGAVASAGEAPMVALQAANNETGVLQPLREAAQIIHAAGGLLVCDGVQAAGRVPLTLPDCGADVLILSSHKLGGPKGAGAVVFADPDAHIAAPMLRGGGQERGARAGTEDIAAIAGFGAACEAVAAASGREAALTSALRAEFETTLTAISPQAQVFGEGVSRLPNTSCFAVEGVSASILLMALDLAGIAVSSGAACSSGRIARSHVLDAMGVNPHMSLGAIRVSFGWNSRWNDAGVLIEALRGILLRVGQIRVS